jgi:hypothetical protein
VYRHPAHAFKLPANLLLGQSRVRGLRRGERRALHDLLNDSGRQSFHQLRFRLMLTVGPSYDVSKEILLH